MPGEFRPFLQTFGSKTEPTVSFDAVCLPASPAPAVPSSCANVAVELKRDGERITQIRVHCKCGEVIELACDYA
jgi:hypothetical protein